MNEDRVLPIITPKPAPLGRRADQLAMWLAGLGAVLSIIGAIWFFLGFAENDTRLEHLTSALVLTLGLFAFAIVPFGCTFALARRAYARGTTRAHLLWTLFLMLPWIALGFITAAFTPLPLYVGVIMAVLATLLSLWAGVSLVLDWKAKPVNTLSSQQDEVPVTTE